MTKRTNDIFFPKKKGCFCILSGYTATRVWLDPYRERIHRLPTSRISRLEALNYGIFYFVFFIIFFFGNHFLEYFFLFVSFLRERSNFELEKLRKCSALQ